MSRLEPNALLAVLLSIAMFATTLQAQDFKDQEGDRSIGRRTLPIAHPSPARVSMFIGLPMWSICLTQVWRMDAYCSVAFVLYSGLIGLRFMVCKTTQADRLSCQLYSVSHTLICVTSAWPSTFRSFGFLLHIYFLVTGVTSMKHAYIYHSVSWTGGLIQEFSTLDLWSSQFVTSIKHTDHFCCTHVLLPDTFMYYLLTWMAFCTFFVAKSLTKNT